MSTVAGVVLMLVSLLKKRLRLQAVFSRRELDHRGETRSTAEKGGVAHEKRCARKSFSFGREFLGLMFALFTARGRYGGARKKETLAVSIIIFP